MNEEREEAQGLEEPEVREIGEEELKEILAEHRRWMESNGLEGAQANLSNVDLQGAALRGANLQRANLVMANLKGANLRFANLQGAYLQGANLQECNLQGANLQRANLMIANLQGANLLGAKLWDADLQDANLTDVTGLVGDQLPGANVSGAKLPGDIHKFEGLKTVEEASRNARKIFQVMLLACAYSLLTIFSTKDVGLLTNSATSPLPIIQTAIPIAGFFVVAAGILLAIYLYFHIYLQRLWEGLAALPAVFPDGRPLDQRAYPWLLNGLVRSHFALLKDDRPPLSRLQALVSILLAWWVVPATLLLFWGRYLPRHDWNGTTLHIYLLIASIGFGVLSYLNTRATLRGKGVRKHKVYARGITVALGSGVIFFVLSFGAFYGVPPYRATELKATGIRSWVPRAFDTYGFRTFADLEEVDVSTKPPNWTGKKDKEKDEIALVKGARLRRRDLRYADAFRAFLVNADLREAKLQNADLSFADLRGARLRVANLQGVHLQGAYLMGADLQGAVLDNANLKGADLREARNLEPDQVKAARNWVLASYDHDLLTKLGLPPEHNERLKKKDLSNYNLQDANLQEAVLTGFNLQGANLQGANLQGANLQGANLQGANLQGVNLKGADLKGTGSLTVSQLKAAKNWELAFYDDDFLKELGLPPDHNVKLSEKLVELEKKEKAAAGKK